MSIGVLFDTFFSLKRSRKKWVCNGKVLYDGIIRAYLYFMVIIQRRRKWFQIKEILQEQNLGR